jgi:hypothetical protein
MTEIDTIKLPGEEVWETKRRDAFKSDFSWRGELLHGLSSSRKDYWTSFCVFAGFPAFISNLDQGALLPPSAKAMLWILSLDSRQLRRLRANGTPAMLEAESEWVDANVAIGEEAAAIELVIDILNASIASDADVQPTAGDKSKN